MYAAFSSFGKAIAIAGALASASLLTLLPAGADEYCDSLSAQLAALSRANAPDPGQSSVLVQELNRAQWQARRFNCTFRFLVPPSPYCEQINYRIAQLKSQLSGGFGGSGWGARMERQRILNAMASYRCPMPRSGFGAALGGGYRTLCVRTCDGYYFPISFSVDRSRLKTDQAVCQAMYPRGEAELYIHRSIGEESDRAVSLKGKPYKDQPFAFAYDKQFTPACKSLLTLGLANLAEHFEAKTANGATAGGRSRPVPPIPAARPVSGEDPETLANRAGDFSVTPDAGAAVALSDINKAKPVRVVGGFFYTLPSEEETARMNMLKRPRLLAADKAPVAAGMVPEPPDSVRGALTDGGDDKVGLP